MLLETANAVSAAALGSEIRPTWLRVVLKTVKNAPRITGDYVYDILRFLRHSSTLRYRTRDSMASKITATCHGVERGLALPDPRPGFGAKNIGYLLRAIDEYVRRFGKDESLRASAGALKAYLRFNECRGLPDFPRRGEIEQVLRRLESIGSAEDGGTVTLRRADLQRAVSDVSDEFFFTRHSIRQFTHEEVCATEIDEAIAIAQRAPAVCNRQECSVTVVHDKALMQKMLAIQGSKGFNHQIDKLLVVTNRLTAFGGMGERNQCWIDGGLFAMSLVLGLHSKGLGTCCLNWSKSAPEDRAMQRLLKIPAAEVIIMLVAVGHVPAELLVARSLRRPLATVRRHILDESEIGVAHCAPLSASGEGRRALTMRSTCRFFPTC